FVPCSLGYDIGRNTKQRTPTVPFVERNAFEALTTTDVWFGWGKPVDLNIVVSPEFWYRNALDFFWMVTGIEIHLTSPLLLLGAGKETPVGVSRSASYVYFDTEIPKLLFHFGYCVDNFDPKNT